jgi:hypothetical protein
MTGDTNDMLSRLKSVLPARWFADVTPVLDAVLTGLATSWSGLYALLTNVAGQARIATATGIFLDIVSTDYFGPALPRRVGEADAAFSTRIRANLVSPRATRAGVSLALTNLTGRAPDIFEPMNAADTGGYNTNTLGYGVAGGYGSRNLAFQFFMTAYRPNATPVSNAGFYNTGPGGYGTGPMFYVNSGDVPGAISDADIYAAAAGALPAASIAWMNISN